MTDVVFLLGNNGVKEITVNSTVFQRDGSFTKQKCEQWNRANTLYL